MHISFLLSYYFCITVELVTSWLGEDNICVYHSSITNSTQGVMVNNVHYNKDMYKSQSWIEGSKFWRVYRFPSSYETYLFTSIVLLHSIDIRRLDISSILQLLLQSHGWLFLQVWQVFLCNCYRSFCKFVTRACTKLL